MGVSDPFHTFFFIPTIFQFFTFNFSWTMTISFKDFPKKLIFQHEAIFYLQRYILPKNPVHLIEPPQRCIFHRMKYFLLLHPCHCVWWTSFHHTWKLSSIKTCGKILRLSKKMFNITLHMQLFYI